MVRFVKGDVKEDIAREYFKAAEREGRFGVVMVGVAQERTSAWRGWRDGGPHGHPHFEYRRQSIFPNNYYWYIRDPDWGPAFLKTTAYAPYSVWLYLNGNEWAKRQAAQRGIAFTPLDNGFASCENPAALAEICASLQAQDVQLFFDRWQTALPSPLSAEDRARGYHHELAFRQAEISDTRMFDRPAAGRAWFERTLPDQLTLGAAPTRWQSCSAAESSAKPPDAFTRRSSTKGSSPRSRCTTAPRRSSSTSKRAARSGPRPPSTTPATSGSADDSPRPTGTRSSTSATRSTSASSIINLRRASARQTPRRFSAWCCHRSKMA